MKEEARINNEFIEWGTPQAIRVIRKNIIGGRSL
jgi:hypothetical protein